MSKIKKVKPMGKLSPWVWSVEIVRGCNLKCWHCTAHLIEANESPRFMSMNTWESMCKIMAESTPFTRLELAQGGEPTLHPHLLECIKMAKRISPTTQLQVTTNGLTLLSGKITFKEIFDAGASMVYIDMYGPLSKYLELVKESGAEWYKYDKPRKIASSPDHRMANTYYGDPMKLVILQDHPEERLKWRKVGRLSTFFNHVDWNRCLPYGLVPVREPLQRKCNLPMRYVSLSVDGDYIFCCIDFWCESAGLLGNVSDGSKGFNEYWFGRLTQSIRRHIKVGNRSLVPYCSRCNCAFSKCDWTGMWPDEAYESYFENGEWKKLPPVDKDNEVFSSGWEYYNVTMDALPTIEEENKILVQSSKRIIHSVKATKKKRIPVLFSTKKQGRLF